MIDYCIRRADGDDMGDFAWVVTTGPDDWQPAVDDQDGQEGPVEYELLRFSMEVLAKRTFGTEHPCDEWTGYHRPTQSWWTYRLTTDGSGETWLARDATIGHFTDKLGAELFLAELPDPVYIVVSNDIVPIAKNRLTIERNDLPGYHSACSTCGHRFESHAVERGVSR